jgi:hypothetical protein
VIGAKTHTPFVPSAVIEGRCELALVLATSGSPECRFRRNPSLDRLHVRPDARRIAGQRRVRHRDQPRPLDGAGLLGANLGPDLGDELIDLGGVGPLAQVAELQAVEPPVDLSSSKSTRRPFGSWL